MPGAEDKRVIEHALQGARILLTEDKDFGRPAYAAGHRTSNRCAVLASPQKAERASLPAVAGDTLRA
jgi:Domain of unknown function (DUF5615)